MFLWAFGLLLLFITGFLFFQPRCLFDIITRVVPGALFYVNTTHQVIALTIDDGPDPRTTPKLLDILSKYGVHTTFFLISSKIPGNESIVRRIIQEGHEIGNHNTTDVPSINFSEKDFAAQLLEADKTLKQFSEIHWYRPGSGWYTPRMIYQAQELGYQVALASLHPFDPQIPFPAYAKFQILTNVQPGAVLLLHDSGTRGINTAETLDSIIPLIKKKGYLIVSLSELIEFSNKR